MTFYYLLLVFSFLVALLQCVIPLWGSFWQRVSWMQLAKSMAWIQFLLLAIVFFGLGLAFFNNDFSLLYVAQNSNSHLPWLYRVCAIWGGHEGSILLWVFMLSVWTVAVSLSSKKLTLPTLAQVIAVLGFISAGFFIILDNTFQSIDDNSTNYHGRS